MGCGCGCEDADTACVGDKSFYMWLTQVVTRLSPTMLSATSRSRSLIHSPFFPVSYVI